MYTDASGHTGFGSVLDIPLEARRVHRSFWLSEEMQQIICVKKLKAVKIGLIEHATVLQRHTVLLYQDNMAVMVCLRNLTSTSLVMMVQLRAVLKVLDEFQIRFQIVYIRTELNPIDALSRLCSADLWSLSPRIQKQLLVRAQRELGSAQGRQHLCYSSTRPCCDWHGQPAAGLVSPHNVVKSTMGTVGASCRQDCLSRGQGRDHLPSVSFAWWFANVSRLPGLLLKIPPPCFSVVTHHPGRVEPRCNHAVQLLALVFQVSAPPASAAPQVPKVDSKNAWRPQRWARESWLKWFIQARR